jgi:hypothetical protein
MEVRLAEAGNHTRESAMMLSLIAFLLIIDETSQR